MAAILSRMPDLPIRPPSPTPPPSPQLTLNTSVCGTPAAVPNKHLPYCSPGPEPKHGLISPPASPPPSADSPLENTSLLYPPISYPKLEAGSPIYTITASSLAKAMNHVAVQPLPDPNVVFPWLHGLHPDNHFQLNFFNVRKRAAREVPRRLRGLTVVKVGGDMNRSRIKGAITPEELLVPLTTSKSPKKKDASLHDCGTSFIDIDPKVGFNVRNFHIQACKMATVSDIIVYGDDFTPRSDVTDVAEAISAAQKAWSKRPDMVGRAEGKFNTFVLIDSFSCVLQNHPEIISVDTKGASNPSIMDFCRQERIEMATLSATSQISHNVFLGPSPDPSTPSTSPSKDAKFDILLEATDFAPIPDAAALLTIEQRATTTKRTAKSSPIHMQFPPSGSLAPSTGPGAKSTTTSSDAPTLDGLLQTCRWINRLANDSTTPRRFLIHCADGYTETTLLALAYLMFSLHLPASAAWIELHTTLKRNFFAYPADKLLLERFQLKLARELPGYGRRPESLLTNQPLWMASMDGSLPSRILEYLYLGNLTHANNPGLLRMLGIRRVLSVGEPISWSNPTVLAELNDAHHSHTPGSDDAASDWKDTDFLYIDRVQDNGTDPLTGDFERCLAFIEEGRKMGVATLVHCRVGVSRSATICIAEVMREKELSFARAYTFVRARRLNVIIQPHLRFAYELLKWEEDQCVKQGRVYKREFEWATIAREIAGMNRPYCKSGG